MHSNTLIGSGQREGQGVHDEEMLLWAAPRGPINKRRINKQLTKETMRHAEKTRGKNSMLERRQKTYDGECMDIRRERGQA